MIIVSGLKMIRKRCGLNLGREILNEAKRIFEVHDFWRKLSPLNVEIKKALKGEFKKVEFQANRILITEIETVNGLRFWLQHSKVRALFNPTNEEIRKEVPSPQACFFLFTPEEFTKRQGTEDFQRIMRKLPKPLNLSIISHDSQLNYEEVLSAFSEVRELPYCARYITEPKESTLVNLVIFLILLTNYMEFCCETMYCTEEKIQKCRHFMSKFLLAMKKEFFDLIRLNDVYYPLSLYMRHKFPEIYTCINISSYVSKYDAPLELAIFLHDAYQMGVSIYPGYGIATDIEGRPDAYLLNYTYPLEKSIPLKQVSALILLNALERKGYHVKEFLENVEEKIKKLPLGGDVEKLLLRYTWIMDNFYELWRFNPEVVSFLYAIWKLKRILESSYQRTKEGLPKLGSSKAKELVERINSLLYEYKDFLEHDLALELGIHLKLVKEFFKNIDEVAKDENEVDAIEQVLLLYHDSARERLKKATVSYATKKIAAPQIFDNILSILKQMDDMNHSEILESLPYVATLFNYPVFSIDDEVAFLQILRNKRLHQTVEVINFIKKALRDEMIRPSLSIEIDKLVNEWETGNPMNFFKNEIEEKIEQDLFDPGLFKKAFKIFCSFNVLNLFRCEPSRFFDYQHVLDEYVSLQIKESGKQYFDYFQPITSVFDRIRKLQKENKKVILLIFDGLGFIHSYFACLEMSRKESKQLSEFSKSIVNFFQKGNAEILSSHIPTVTGVNHIALFFGEKLLYDDSFLIRATDNSFMPDKGEDKARIFSILNLNEQDRKSAIWRLRLEEGNLQRPTSLWDNVRGQTLKGGLLISTNSERTFLSYLFKGNATFKQVGSYTSAIDEALSDKTHDLVISQVNLMDAFLQALNTPYPPALFNDAVKDYWEVYLDLWKNVTNRISDGLKKLKKGTVVVITADHGLALGRTSEFKRPTQILGAIKGVTCQSKHRTSELVSEDNRLIGACIPGHTSRKFMSIFLLKDGLDKKDTIKEALDFAKQANEVVFEEIIIEENKRNLTIKPDFIVFPIIGMFARPDKKKYYGGIHGGISMCEVFIPLIQLEK
jgi:hypothetical protein